MRDRAILGSLLICRENIVKQKKPIEIIDKMFDDIVQKLGHGISFKTISTVYLQYDSTCNLFKRFTSLDNLTQYINDFQELYHISQNLRTIMSTYQKFDY